MVAREQSLEKYSWIIKLPLMHKVKELRKQNNMKTSQGFTYGMVFASAITSTCVDVSCSIVAVGLLDGSVITPIPETAPLQA